MIIKTLNIFDKTYKLDKGINVITDEGNIFFYCLSSVLNMLHDKRIDQLTYDDSFIVDVNILYNNNEEK